MCCGLNKKKMTHWRRGPRTGGYRTDLLEKQDRTHLAVATIPVTCAGPKMHSARSSYMAPGVAFPLVC